MYAAPPEIETKVFTRLPDEFRESGKKTLWSQVSQMSGDIHSFLEGPSFDLDGNLYCVDIPWGRIFKISPKGEWTLVVQYEGNPNGLKIHKDGRIFIADRLRGIMVLDPDKGVVEPLLTQPNLDPLRGCNDLVFASNGDLYFTDPGRSSLNNPTGRVYRLKDERRLELLIVNAPFPNGLVLNAAETHLMVAVTKANAIWRFPVVMADDIEVYGDSTATPVGLFIQLSGGHSGPDGLALDQEGNLAIAHSAHGTAWLFSAGGEPLLRIRSTAGERVTNLAYGGSEGKTLYITESGSGSILTAEVEVPGRVMFSHM
jgi:gluconolactonase